MAGVEPCAPRAAAKGVKSFSTDARLNRTARHFSTPRFPLSPRLVGEKARPSVRFVDLARSLERRSVVPATQGGHPQENVMILALPLAIAGAAFLTYVRLATH